MAANLQKAVLVGGFEPFPWRTGIPVDVFNMRTALFDVYGLGSDDVSVLVSPPFTGPDGVGTAINVWTTVLEAYQQLEEAMSYYILPVTEIVTLPILWRIIAAMWRNCSWPKGLF
jgi:hypothetical protein